MGKFKFSIENLVNFLTSLFDSIPEPDYELNESPNPPILILTVCNRYFELIANLKRIHRGLINEFPIKPIIVIIWARPDEDKRWIFDILRKNNYFDYLIERPPLEGENGPTSYPESFNIRLGLAFAHNNYPDSYVILQACDSFFRPNLYNFMCNSLQNGAKIVATSAGFAGNLLCTGGFGIQPKYINLWPPLSNSSSCEILEFDWKKSLGRTKITYFLQTESFGYFHSHNYEDILNFLRCEIICN